MGILLPSVFSAADCSARWNLASKWDVERGMAKPVSFSDPLLAELVHFDRPFAARWLGSESGIEFDLLCCDECDVDFNSNRFETVKIAPIAKPPIEFGPSKPRKVDDKIAPKSFASVVPKHSHGFQNPASPLIEYGQAILGEDDTLIHEFSVDEIENLSKPLRFALVGKFSHGLPYFKAIKDFLNSMKFVGEFSFRVINSKHVLFILANSADLSRLWLRRFWTVGGKPMRLFRWTPDFDSSIESAVTPVWIRLPEIPLHLYERQVLFCLAKRFGTPLRLDEAVFRNPRDNFAWFCVEIDLSKPIPKFLQLRYGSFDTKIPVIVENLPEYCSHCKHIGHSITSYFLNGSKVRPKDKGQKQTEKQSDEAADHKVFEIRQAVISESLDKGQEKQPICQVDTPGSNMVDSLSAAAVPTNSKQPPLDSCIGKVHTPTLNRSDSLGEEDLDEIKELMDDEEDVNNESYSDSKSDDDRPVNHKDGPPTPLVRGSYDPMKVLAAISSPATALRQLPVPGPMDIGYYCPGPSKFGPAMANNRAWVLGLEAPKSKGVQLTTKDIMQDAVDSQKTYSRSRSSSQKKITRNPRQTRRTRASFKEFG